NGIDDNGNGLIDEPQEMLLHVNPNGSFTYSTTGGEYEQDVPNLPIAVHSTYVINRRPVPAKGAREILLPNNVVVDMTTLNALNPNGSERSRLPIDPYTHAVDILVSPDGRLVQSAPASGSVPPFDLPFFH